jgi:hypothetical protein
VPPAATVPPHLTEASTTTSPIVIASVITTVTLPTAETGPATTTDSSLKKFRICYYNLSMKINK